VSTKLCKMSFLWNIGRQLAGQALRPALHSARPAVITVNGLKICPKPAAKDTAVAPENQEVSV
jgi:hypothetical protein